MHSNDFNVPFSDDEKIDGKTRGEWEAEFGIVGLVEHLKGLGWERYQWRHVTADEADRAAADYEKRHGKKPTRGLTCFAEFFSSYFHGYLRGDGGTVLEAVQHCLATAQRYAACERSPGHTYEPFRPRRDAKPYDNGLLMCRHCGFAGNTTVVESLRREVQHLRIALMVEKERNAEDARYFKEHGESLHDAMARSFESMLSNMAARKNEEKTEVKRVEDEEGK